MDLATHQRTLLGLMRSSSPRPSPGSSTGHRCQPPDPDAAYFSNVSQSVHLHEARRNVFLWRVYVLQRTAALTFNLLKQRGLLEPALHAFIARHNISPFRETQAPAFLEGLCSHDDPLVSCVARFELALLNSRMGHAEPRIIPWDVDPRGILNSLARDTPLEECAPGAFEIIVSRDLPSGFRIVELEPASPITAAAPAQAAES